MPMNLQTPNLTIRPFTTDDKYDLLEIYSDVETCKYLLNDPWTKMSLNSETKKKQLANNLTTKRTLSLACVHKGKVIGDFSLWYTDMKDTLEIGVVFNKKYAGKGFAQEAGSAIFKVLFDEYLIHRIFANMDSRNVASAKFCKKLGMRKEAHFIKDYWNKDEWTDSYIYAILKEDHIEL